MLDVGALHLAITCQKPPPLYSESVGFEVLSVTEVFAKKSEPGVG